jgi:hypothetical protein
VAPEPAERLALLGLVDVDHVNPRRPVQRIEKCDGTAVPGQAAQAGPRLATDMIRRDQRRAGVAPQQRLYSSPSASALPADRPHLAVHGGNRDIRGPRGVRILPARRDDVADRVGATRAGPADRILKRTGR